MLLLGLLCRAADDRIEPGHDLERLRRASVFVHAALHVAVKFLSPRQAVLRGEDAFRGPRRQLAADLRRAGLEDDRMTLRRPRHIEGPAHREMLSLVVQYMQLGRMEIAAGDAVADKGVVV